MCPHPLSGVAQVFHELLVDEEEEKVKEQGRQEEEEVESGEDQGEETTTWMTMVMECGQGSNLSQCECG